MSNDPWSASELDDLQTPNEDPWNMDLNTDDLIERDMFLKEPALSQKLQVVKVEDNPTQSKPCKKITFKIVQGEYESHLVSDFFYGTVQAKWRLRELYIACGFSKKESKEKADGTYKEIVHVDPNIRPTHCIGQFLIADCVDSNSPDGKFYARIDNMRPVK